MLQSEGLLYISWARLDNLNNQKQIELLKKGLRIVIKSYDFYKKEEDSYSSKYYKKLFKLTLIATLNTIVDTKNKIAVLSDDYDEFNRENKQDFAPRIIFDLLKEKLKDEEINNKKFKYLTFPAFNHTEIMLECNEIIFHRNNNNIGLVHKISTNTKKLIQQIKSEKNVQDDSKMYFDDAYKRFETIMKEIKESEG